MFVVLGRRMAVAIALCIMALSAMARPATATEPVMILAAATLKDALDAEIVAADKSLGVEITAVYGPSPALVKQLENGAPGDIFFSADTDWMDQAIAHQVVDPATRIDLLSSKLVLIAPASHQTPAPPIAPGFPLAPMLGASGRLVMCDPMMMPAGRYGRAALQKLGLWDGVKGRIANAENVRAALAYVARQEAPLGIVFDTDARLDPNVRVVGTFPADSHPPIVYPIASVARGRNPDAARVIRFLASPAAAAIFERYGYAVLRRRASAIEGARVFVARD